MNNLIQLSLKKLKLHQIPNPDLDLRILLNFSSKLKKEIFLSNFNYADIDFHKFHSVLDRRLKFEPISFTIADSVYGLYHLEDDETVHRIF